MAYASWSVVFGEQPTAAKWNILGTNDAYFNGLVGSGTAWSSWSPSYTNITVGSGSVSAKYQQFGKTVFYRITIVFGAGMSIASGALISLPVTSVAIPGTADRQVIGYGTYQDTGTANYYAVVRWNTTTTMKLMSLDGANSTGYNTVSNTIPFTWVSTDEIHLHGMYEAA